MLRTPWKTRIHEAWDVLRDNRAEVRTPNFHFTVTGVTAEEIGRQIEARRRLEDGRA